MLQLKHGRRAPVHTLHTVRTAMAMARALAPLGAPPAVSDDYVSAVDKATGGNWGMFLNNQLGCCVPADSGHQVMLHTANGGSIVIPTDQQILAMYEAVGGYVPGNASTDNGCVEQDACQYLQTMGLAGVKSAGSGFIDPAKLDHIRWAVQLFGACRLGINITTGQMTDFNQAQPWVTMTGEVEGGHDVPIVRYDSQYAYVVTWGKLQPVAWHLLALPAFLEEAHAEVWPSFVRAGGTAPNGFDMQTLIADLQQVEIQQAA